MLESAEDEQSSGTRRATHGGTRARRGRRAAPPPRAASQPTAIRAASLAGEGLLTLGVILVLFLVYELWWTNVEAGLSRGNVDRRVAAQLTRPQTNFADGQAFGYLFVPAFGSSYKVPLLQGTGLNVLSSGVGHYDNPNTAMPWQVGNFSIAGHDDVHGEVFRDLDENILKPGDQVIVETGMGWYVYQMDAQKTVTPSNIGVIAAIPQGSPYTKPGHYITLTTCTPLWVDNYRRAWWGHLVSHTAYNDPPSVVANEQ